MITIIVGLVSAFIAFRTYQVTKQKNIFEQKNQLRSLLKEFLLFEGKYRNDVGNLSFSLSKASSIEEIKNIEHTPMLLNLITENNLRDHSSKKVSSLVSKIYKIHRKNILLRNLYIYSLKDSIQVYPKVLNDYEKTIIYTTILYVYIKDKKFYKEVNQFYKLLIDRQDYENQFRLGLVFVEAELKNDMLTAAKNHLEEISDSLFVSNVKIAKSNIKFPIKRLELLLKKKTIEIQLKNEESELKDSN